MTFWAKVLTIVIFVLSIAFASMSAVVFAKREDYRGQLANMTALEQSNEAKAQAAEAKLKAERQAAMDKSAETTAKLNALQLQFDTVSHQLERLNSDLKEAQSNFRNEQDKSLALTHVTEQLGQQVKDMAVDQEKLKAEKDDYYAKMTEERKRANQFEKGNTDLKARLDTTTASLKDAQDTIKLNEDTFSELARRNIEAREIISGLTAVPEIKGKVALVEPGSNSVILNVGRKQGVKKNYEFTIFRGDKFIAKVSVYDTEDELSAARIVTGGKQAIQRGDAAATRLVGQ